MEIKQIAEILDEYIPLNLSDAACSVLGVYDNSGLLIDCGGETDCLLFALDLCSGAVEEAVQCGAKMIITHHPAIYKPIKHVDGLYAKCIANGISVYSAHLCLDIANGGIEDGLAEFFGTKNVKILESVIQTNGFGRAFDVEPKSFEEICRSFTQTFNLSKFMAFGKKNAVITKVATFCGAGLDESAIKRAYDCDLLISADIQHHVLLAALEQGKCVLQLTHYASEVFAMKKFAQKLCDQKIKINNCFYFDERFL